MDIPNMTKRESNKINCRERILKASRRLFTSKGYEETMAFSGFGNRNFIRIRLVSSVFYNI